MALSAALVPCNPLTSSWHRFPVLGHAAPRVQERPGLPFMSSEVPALNRAAVKCECQLSEYPDKCSAAGGFALSCVPFLRCSELSLPHHWKEKQMEFYCTTPLPPASWSFFIPIFRKTFDKAVGNWLSSAVFCQGGAQSCMCKSRVCVQSGAARAAALAG